jgi:hypothetical protein
VDYDSVADEFRQLGVANPVDVMGGRPRADDGFELLPENAPVFNAFTCLSTQWRMLAGMAGALYQGLDYQAIPTVLRMLGLPETPDTFNDLRAMELAALPILNS